MVGGSAGTFKNARVWSVIGFGKRIFMPTNVRQNATDERRRYMVRNDLW
jgi:hypothetical protein